MSAGSKKNRATVAFKPITRRQPIKNPGKRKTKDIIKGISVNNSPAP